ncbi:response regulator receiver domain protein [Leptospira broomii serovar Hurstbridge str. 5399]|uniref:Response regulator receiver domain protein n=1 Tax=Leptospira broomii serovar Hurstbridge str. 5399 TaxID=1049789 RepID=T0FAK6_9LEPT|nr:response regulator receiver domain protein [Leptospira broomii serovar Hurstbridge str. 5399]
MIVSEFADPEFQVVETASLNESAMFAWSEKFDLITLGIYFQDGTGFDLCKRIRTEKINDEPFASFDTRIIFVTSEYNDANRIKAHDAGANGFLEKNSNLISFRETLAIILKDLKSERQNAVERFKFSKDSDPKISLLVDDSELNLVLFRRLLESRGIKVQTAISGEHALRLLSENPNQYGVLLTDMYMPNMDGDQLCKKIQGIPGLSELRLGIVTASNEAELARTKIPPGVKILTKPYDPDQIMKFINPN